MSDTGPGTFKIGRRAFTIIVNGANVFLVGKRDATYIVMPHRDNPRSGYLASTTRVDPLGPVTLSLDDDGIPVAWSGASNT